MKIDRQLFRTGIQLIDNQHEAYLDLLDSLFELCKKDHVEEAEVRGAIAAAFTYAIEHFDAEETLMRSIDYSGLEAHRAKHDEFREEADRFSDPGYGGMTPEARLVHLTKWLVEWFCEQTQVYDLSLATALKKHHAHGGN